jgi:hypothetical protein
MSIIRLMSPSDWAAPDKPEVRAARHRFHEIHGVRAAVVNDVICLPFRVHDQESFGSCMGQSVTAGIEEVAQYPVSGLKLWRDGRRLQGDELNIDEGTTPEMVFQALRECGWSPWHEGEDADDTEAAREGNPADDIWGYSTRQDGKIQVAQIEGSAQEMLAQIAEARAARWGVVMTSGLKDPFFSLRDGQLATSAHIGGNVNGHAQNVLGVAGGVPYIQNSWGLGFAGMTLPDGRKLAGCYTMDPAVLTSLWDCIAYRVQP